VLLCIAAFIGYRGYREDRIRYAKYGDRKARRKSEQKAKSERKARRKARRRAEQARGAIKRLRHLKTQDPTFSRALFTDFAVLLYSRFQHARDDDDNFASIQPYFTPKIFQRLKKLADTSVDEVVVGALLITGVNQTSDSVRITVQFKASMLLNGARKFVRESWIFERQTGVQSLPPDKIMRLSCPSCGAAGELTPGGKCTFCNNVVNTGKFHWVVAGRQIHNKRPLPRLSVSLHGGGVEVGTALPTKYQHEIESLSSAFSTRNPAFDEERFKSFVQSTFLALQRAWSARDWGKARPLETDNLYQTHRFWMERYTRDGLINKLEGMQVSRVEIVAYPDDPFFDVITVRIFASMLDYTIRESNGKLVGGNKDIIRSFSEYWTFIRTAGANTADEPFTQCPSCGAALELNASGICPHCDTHVTSGNFSWVLSLIEQDEEYVG
jgi:predicted lipid-binding transport protein (Tim44 family)